MESVSVRVQNEQGQSFSVTLSEESAYSDTFVGKLSITKSGITSGNETIKWKKGETIKVSYGLGYFQKDATYLRMD
ncbi:hypothetical protein [Aquiflexum balticum]|uniref:hypothetical protein n=1 Tax=Aquiflexum balticum TaxID=280473 RepID=UPI0012F95FAA|nr:hypothetical protein [Aquiflexum balticum]